LFDDDFVVIAKGDGLFIPYFDLYHPLNISIETLAVICGGPIKV
jgi:hypothetical protein